MTELSISGDVHADIQGEVTGQAFVGNYVLQIGSVSGGVVNVATPGQTAELRPRPTPILLRPRPFPGLLGRAKEIQTATGALESALPAEFHGEGGIGKTSLLRYLAHHSAEASFPDGIIYLSARKQSVADLLESLFDTFYESNVPFKPTDDQIRHALRGKQALILLDDVCLSRDEVGTFMDTIPSCTFVLSSPEQCLWGEGAPVALEGLSPEDGIKLVEQQLGQSLISEERQSAIALCDALEGHPLEIIQAIALVRQEEMTLVEAAQQVKKGARGQRLTDKVLSSLSEPEQAVLVTLGALGDAPLDVEHLASLTGLENVATILEALQKRGLVQSHSPRYSPTGALGEAVRQQIDLKKWAEQALAYWTDWAQEHLPAPERLQKAIGPILQTMQLGVDGKYWTEVLQLARAIEGELALSGQWGAWERVLQYALAAAQALKDQAAEAWAWHQMGTRAFCLGELKAAGDALSKAIDLREALGDTVGAALSRQNLGIPLSPAPPFSSLLRPAGLPLLTKIAITAAPVLVVAVLGALILWPRPEPLPEDIPTPTLVLEGGEEPVQASEAEQPMTSDNTPTSTPALENMPTDTPSPTPTLTPTPTHTPVTPTDTPTATATRTATPEPSIAFWYDPADVAAGGCTTMHWQTANVQTVTLDRQQVDGSGSSQICNLCAPQSHTLDVLLWNGEHNVQTKTVNVTGSCAPPTATPGGPAHSLPPTSAPPDTEPPPAPVATGPGGPQSAPESIDCSDSVILAWNAVSDPSGIDNYHVVLKDTSTGWSGGFTHHYTTSTFYILNSQVSEPNTYFWFVSARDGAGNQGSPSTLLYFTCDPKLH